jgi:hypothetical protein
MNLPNAHDTLSSIKPEPSARKKNGPLRDHRATVITLLDIPRILPEKDTAYVLNQDPLDHYAGVL